MKITCMIIMTFLLPVTRLQFIDQVPMLSHASFSSALADTAAAAGCQPALPRPPPRGARPTAQPSPPAHPRALPSRPCPRGGPAQAPPQCWATSHRWSPHRPPPNWPWALSWLSYPTTCSFQSLASWPPQTSFRTLQSTRMGLQMLPRHCCRQTPQRGSCCRSLSWLLLRWYSRQWTLSCSSTDVSD